LTTQYKKALLYARFFCASTYLFVNLRLKDMELQTGRLDFLIAERLSDLSLSSSAGHFSGLFELLKAVKKIPYPTLVLKESSYFLNLS